MLGGIKMIYANYKNKIYLANIRQSKVRLKTRMKEQEFNELIDIAGNVHQDIFIKEVNISEVDTIYEVEYRILYKGSEYKCLKVSKELLDTNYITIYTSDRKIAEKYGFIKKEPFIYDKNVLLDEIEGLVEIKKPILNFSYLKEQKIIINQKYVRDYITTIIE